MRAKSYIAVHDAEADWKILCLRFEEGVGCGLPDQLFDRGAVRCASFRLGRISLRETRPDARYIDQSVDAERICLCGPTRRDRDFLRRNALAAQELRVCAIVAVDRVRP